MHGRRRRARISTHHRGRRRRTAEIGIIAFIIDTIAVAGIIAGASVVASVHRWGHRRRRRMLWWGAAIHVHRLNHRPGNGSVKVLTGATSALMAPSTSLTMSTAGAPPAATAVVVAVGVNNPVELCIGLIPVRERRATGTDRTVITVVSCSLLDSCSSRWCSSYPREEAESLGLFLGYPGISSCPCR